MKLSILIRSLEDRAEMLALLLEHLNNQMTGDVEVLTDIDNGEMTSGEKANQLLKRAKGKYIVFIDDDDWVADYYVAEMLKAIESDADCFCINGTITTDGLNEIGWELSMRHPNLTIQKNGRLFYLRTTNHITAVKREHALKAGFPDKSNGEDKAYSDKLRQYLRTEYKIHPPMYHYRFSTMNKSY